MTKELCRDKRLLPVYSGMFVFQRPSLSSTTSRSHPRARAGARHDSCLLTLLEAEQECRTRFGTKAHRGCLCDSGQRLARVGATVREVCLACKLYGSRRAYRVAMSGYRALSAVFVQAVGVDVQGWVRAIDPWGASRGRRAGHRSRHASIGWLK
jgi:hypothetical protein